MRSFILLALVLSLGACATDTATKRTAVVDHKGNVRYIGSPAASQPDSTAPSKPNRYPGAHP